MKSYYEFIYCRIFRINLCRNYDCLNFNSIASWIDLRFEICESQLLSISIYPLRCQVLWDVLPQVEMLSFRFNIIMSAFCYKSVYLIIARTFSCKSFFFFLSFTLHFQFNCIFWMWIYLLFFWTLIFFLTQWVSFYIQFQHPILNVCQL